MITPDDKRVTDNDTLLKEEAFESLKKIRVLHSGDDVSISYDYKKELMEYLDEKYGSL